MSTSPNRAVFLDRDGVLNDVVIRNGSAGSPRTLSEFTLNTEARSTLARLSREGYVLVAITNQPDIARGNVESSVIHEQNRRLMDALPIDAIYMCPHDGTDECACRKPQPGMLAQAARELDLDLANSWLIGDRWVDLAAASAAGVAAVLLARAWSWEATSAGEPPENLRRVPTADSLAACIDLILAGSDSPAGA